MKKHKILIVDSLSGGRFFPEIAKNKFGVECYHLLSSDTLPDYYKNAFMPENFTKCFIWSEMEHTILLNLFRDEGITAVIAGTETGVTLADRISEELKLITNGTALSRARRSKTLMHEVVSMNGVRIPIQAAIASEDEGILFINTKLKYPLVVKPDDSAGTDGFFLVGNESEFKNAFQNLYNKTNRLGSLNSKIILQEFISGEEYAINSVSANGKHFITHIWQYHKKIIESGKVYDWEEYISPTSELGKTIVDFTVKTLDGLGIKYGAAHTEVMLDSKGLVLIESASRVDGMCNPKVDDACIGLNQVYLSLLSYLDPDKLEGFIKNNFKNEGTLANVSLISDSDSTDTIKQINLEILNTIESYKDIRVSVKIGERLSKTKDIFTSPGFIYMFNKDKDSIFRDYLKIREIELKNLLFKI